jgi:hypothetical protein
MTNDTVFMRVRNFSTNGILLIDDVTASGMAANDSWADNNAQVDADTPHRRFVNRSCYLNDGLTGIGTPMFPELPPHVKSAFLTNGIGEISFWYRNWSTNVTAPGAATLLIQASETGVTNPAAWTTITTIPFIINTREYSYFRTSLFDRINHYVRIVNQTNPPAYKACLDDILVTAPMGADISISNLTITPVAPLYSNTVAVSAVLYNHFLNPSNVRVHAVYAVDTNYNGSGWSNTNMLEMICVESNPAARWYRYQTPATNPIPMNPADSFVSYFVRCTFDGYNSQGTSPKTNKVFLPPSWYAPLDAKNGSNVPYYIVLSCPTGAVWINEVDPIQSGSSHTKDFIELCGWANSDISGWCVEDLNSAATTQAVYSIPYTTVIADTTNGFGFWVLGKTNVANQNQLLTNNLSYAGGVRLSRKVGIYECAVCYGSSSGAVATLISQGFRYLGQDLTFLNNAFRLMGTGSTYNAFSWAITSTGTPGYVNYQQVLVPLGPTNGIIPTVWILSIRRDTNIWLVCTGTNNWAPTPWYTTNLVETNSWTNMTGGTFQSTYPSLSNGTYTIWFDILPNSPKYFYKVVTTNATP